MDLWIITQSGELHSVLGIYYKKEPIGVEVYGYNQSNNEILLGTYQCYDTMFEIISEITKKSKFLPLKMIYEVPRDDRTIYRNGKKEYLRINDYDKYKEYMKRRDNYAED